MSGERTVSMTLQSCRNKLAEFLRRLRRTQYLFEGLLPEPFWVHSTAAGFERFGNKRGGELGRGAGAKEGRVVGHAAGPHPFPRERDPVAFELACERQRAGAVRARTLEGYGASINAPLGNRDIVRVRSARAHDAEQTGPLYAEHSRPRSSRWTYFRTPHSCGTCGTILRGQRCREGASNADARTRVFCRTRNTNTFGKCPRDDGDSALRRSARQFSRRWCRRRPVRSAG